MNFISAFNELDKLYEDAKNEPEAAANDADVEATEETAETTDRLTEADEDEEIEVVEDELRQLIIECDKCGALVIKNEADIAVDEDSGLVNVEDECQFCEEAKGYKIIGVVAPYEVIEDEEPAEDAAEEVVAGAEEFDEVPAEEETPTEEE